MLLEQAELRRRIKAAMALSDIDGYRALAEKTDYKYGTIKALGAGRDASPRHLREIAAACEVPYEWFTVPDLREAISAYAEAVALPGALTAQGARAMLERLQAGHVRALGRARTEIQRQPAGTDHRAVGPAGDVA